MNALSEKKLSRVQTHVLEILVDLIAIMDEIGIPYFMQGGTMLGAVRHKGFIPWDDDVDLAIPRKYYDLFLEQISSHLPAHLKLRTYQDDSDHHYYFARIVNPEYLVKRLGGVEVRTEEVWVDVFPLDGMPRNRIARFFHKINLTFCRMMFHVASIEKVNVKRPGRTFVEKLIIYFVLATKINRFFDPRKWLDRVDALLKKYTDESSDYYVNFSGQTSYRFNEMIKKDVYGDGALYDFEHIKMRGPKDFDCYLTSLYGDYMVPPKMTERNAHQTEVVSKD